MNKTKETALSKQISIHSTIPNHVCKIQQANSAKHLNVLFHNHHLSLAILTKFLPHYFVLP
jgi:hypothetical protein